MHSSGQFLKIVLKDIVYERVEFSLCIWTGVRVEEPDLARSSYATLWQVQSPLTLNTRSGASNQTISRTEAAWQLSSGQQILKGPRAKSGNATARIHRSLQRVLRFVQSNAYVTGKCDEVTR